MKIQVMKLCKNCNGDKVIYDPSWREFNQLNNDHPDWELKQECEYQYRKGRSERVWKSWLVDKEGNRYEAPSGPEEYDCDECNGTGEAVYWIKIEEVAKLLKKVLNYNPSLDEALNSGDGTYKP